MKKVINIIAALIVIAMVLALCWIALLFFTKNKLYPIYEPYTGALIWLIIGLTNLYRGMESLEVARKQDKERRWYSVNKFLYGLFGLSLGLAIASLQVMRWFAPGDKGDTLVYSVTGVPLALCFIFLALMLRNVWQRRKKQRVQEIERHKQRHTA